MQGLVPLHRAKEFGHDPVRRDGGAVHRDEGIIGAVGHLVQLPRGQLLARAAGTGEEHRRRHRGKTVEHAADLRQRLGLAEHLHRRATLQLAPEQGVVAAQVLAVQCARHRAEDLICPEGFQHEITHARPECGNGGFKIGIGGDQDRVGVEPLAALFDDPFQTGLAGHDIVQHDHIEMRLVQELGGLRRRSRLGHAFDARLQYLGEEMAHPRFIVDHKDRRAFERAAVFIACRHDMPLWCQSSRTFSPE